jgi:hypothetical protein
VDKKTRKREEEKKNKRIRKEDLESPTERREHSRTHQKPRAAAKRTRTMIATESWLRNTLRTQVWSTPRATALCWTTAAATMVKSRTASEVEKTQAGELLLRMVYSTTATKHSGRKSSQPNMDRLISEPRKATRSRVLGSLCRRYARWLGIAAVGIRRKGFRATRSKFPKDSGCFGFLMVFGDFKSGQEMMKKGLKSRSRGKARRGRRARECRAFIGTIHHLSLGLLNAEYKRGDAFALPS